MSQRIACPIPEFDDVTRSGEPVYYIDLPDQWLGLHAQRYDEAIERTAEGNLGGTLRTFVAALALLDSWNLPGLSMQQVESGDVTPVSLELIIWVTTATMRSYRAVTTVPKGLSVPLSVLGRIAEKTDEAMNQENTDGSSESES